MAQGQTPSFHWIDHIVVGTNDMNHWTEWAMKVFGFDHAPIGGLTTVAQKARRPINCFLDIGDGSCHFGAFLQHEAMPREELGKGMPRYGFYIRPEEIERHLRRLDVGGVAYLDPVRTAEEGEEGTAIAFEDPDGNQFELWAPAVMPDGAMEVATAAGVGRISSAVYRARNLTRTTDFWSDYFGLTPTSGDDVPEDVRSFRLVGGARLVYRLAQATDDRTAGHRPWYALHTAFTIKDEDYLSHYYRLWDELPEWDDDAERTRESEDAEPVRTGLHTSPVGRRWKATYGRGDEFYDWDSHAFHLIGGISTRGDGSMATYTPKDQEAYLLEYGEARQKATIGG